MSTTIEKVVTPTASPNGDPAAPTITSVADFVARVKPRPQKHYLASANSYAFFVPLDAGRRRDLDRLQVKEKATFNPETGKDDIEYVYDPVGHQLAAVMLAWSDESGDKRLAGQAGLDLIGQLPQEVVAEAYDIVSKISGFAKGAAEKNSDKSRGGTASSSSR